METNTIKPEKLRIVMKNDQVAIYPNNQGIWGIYNIDGQAIETDFDSDEEAFAYAEEMGYIALGWFL